MGTVLGVWRNAVGELRDAAAEGPETLRRMESGVRWGLLIGWLIWVMNIAYEILADKTVRGFNVAFLMVFISQTVITYSFIPTVLLLAKLIKFSLRAGATASIRQFFLTIGEETCQVIAGVLWTLLQSQIFETYRANSICMRFHTCEAGSYFMDFETIVNKICDDEAGLCMDLSYNTPWIIMAVIVYFGNSFLQSLWAPENGANPPPPAPEGSGPQGDIPQPSSAPPAPAPTNGTNPPAPGDGDGDAPPPDPDMGDICAALVAWIQRSIQELLDAEEAQKREKERRRAARRSKQGTSRSRSSRSRKNPCDGKGNGQ